MILDGMTTDDVFERVIQLCPSTRNPVLCPCEARDWPGLRPRGPVMLPVGSMIVHLNDDHRWTRERIADWLDTLDIDLTLTPSTTNKGEAPCRAK